MATAVKVTELPEHDGLLPAVIEVAIEVATVLFTVIVIPLEVMLTGLAHKAFEVMLQVTIFPLASVVVVKVALVAPVTGLEFIFH